MVQPLPREAVTVATVMKERGRIATALSADMQQNTTLVVNAYVLQYYLCRSCRIGRYFDHICLISTEILCLSNQKTNCCVCLCNASMLRTRFLLQNSIPFELPQTC